jgi:hypothetical protein
MKAREGDGWRAAELRHGSERCILVDIAGTLGGTAGAILAMEFGRE